MPGVHATGPAAAVEMLEQRDRDAARRPQRLAGLAGGEGLLEPGQLPHRERGRGGQQHHLVGQAQQPALRCGGGELACAEAEDGEVLGLRGAEGGLGEAPFELGDPGLGARELAAAAAQGRLLRLPDEVVLLPAAPALAMRELARLEQPFTTSEARQALGTTRRVAIPLLEHLDGRGWTRRVDAGHREIVR